jgi:hypothetical protein
VTALATTVAADVTGILLATFVAALGLVIIPAKRRMAKADMEQKIADLRTRLSATLHSHFESEIERSLRDIRSAIAPYTRFVRAEQGKLAQTQSSLEALRNRLNQVKIEIDEL